MTGGTVNNIAGDYIVHGSGDEQLGELPSCKIEAGMLTTSLALRNLEKLSYAEGASWNPTLGCLPGTRAALLSIIDTWAHSKDPQNVLLLMDVAGSGKTAISNTVAKKFYDDGLTTSCFFFERENSSRNTPRSLFTTIARDIATKHPAIAADICASLEEEPALASAHLSRQFEAFIAGPLRRHSVDSQIVVVIDALDEALSSDTDTDLLTILREEVAILSPNFRLFITSRPTRAIEEHLSGLPHVMSCAVNIRSAMNQEDIATYIDVMVRADAICKRMGAPWPDAVLVSELKNMAGGLFIWIATVFRYLLTAHKPRSKLGALLSITDSQAPLEPIKKIDALYAAILEDCGDWEDREFCEDYALFMGSIMAVKRPLSLAALRALHGGNEELSLDRLPQRFGSVLVGLKNEHELIHTLHLSFREFVMGRAAESSKTKKFSISEKEHSQTLAGLSLRTIVRELTITPIIGTGYLLRDDDDKPGIPKLEGVSEPLLYGCEHWGDHVRDIGGLSTTVAGAMREFLRDHHIASIEIVASAATFVGSLAVWHWLNVSFSSSWVLTM